MTRLFATILLFGSTLMAADGATIYKKCVACHGPTAKTVYAGKVPVLAGQDKAKLVESMRGYKAGSVNAYGMGAVMKAQANIHLKSDGDIEAVAEYLAGLK